MTKQLETTVTPEAYAEAVALHANVMTAREQVANSLYNFAKSLKEMKDGEAWRLLNYDSFDSYIEKEVKIAKRQIYNYISTYETLGATVLQSNAQLGITKLALIASSVSDTERPAFLEENDLAGMSVSEIKELISKSKEQCEQVSLLNQQKERLEKEIEEIKSRPVEVAVAEPSQADIDKIKSQAFKEAEKQAKAKIKEVEYKLKKELEETQKAVAAAEDEKARLSERTDKLIKEQQLNADKDIVKITVLFENAKDSFIKLISEIGAAEDKEKQKKLYSAVKKYYETVLSEISTE